MPVAKWDPLRDLWTLQDRVNRLFQEGMARRSGQEEDLQAGQWAPAVDIFESAEKIRYEIRQSLTTRPGVCRTWDRQTPYRLPGSMTRRAGISRDEGCCPAA